MSCCTGGSCGGSSTLAGAAAPFLVQVATGGAESLTRPLDVAYWLGLQDSFTTKVPLSLKSVVALIRTLEGRDKVTKTIQYACRFLWWYHKNHMPTDETRGSRFEKMFRASQTARKCFHLLRTFEELEKLQALSSDTKTPQWRRRLMMLRAAAMAVYWFYDNTCFFIIVKLSTFDQRTAIARDGAAWSLANLISVGLALYDLDQNSKDRRRLEDKTVALLKARAGAGRTSTGISPTHSVAAGSAAEGEIVGEGSTASTVGNGASAKVAGIWSSGASNRSLVNGSGNGVGIDITKELRSRQAVTSTPTTSSSSQPQGGDTVADIDVEEVLVEMARANVKRFDLVGDMLRASCDFVVACNSPGFDLPLRLLGYRLHDGVIGTAGLISAISAVYKAYPSDMERLRKHRLVRLLGAAP